MKVTMRQYETMKMLDIFDGEERILSVNWDDQGVVVMTPEDTHILLFGEEEPPAQRRPFAKTQE